VFNIHYAKHRRCCAANFCCEPPDGKEIFARAHRKERTAKNKGTTKLARAHDKELRQRTAMASARQKIKATHGKELTHDNGIGHCRALPFAVHILFFLSLQRKCD
jgi:hypothetical protein